MSKHTESAAKPTPGPWRNEEFDPPHQRKLAEPQPWAWESERLGEVPQVKTIDDCVRLVTAFTSFEDMKATEPTYAPTFYLRGTTMVEREAQRRVVAAFNAWAAREGRARRAEIRS